MALIEFQNNSAPYLNAENLNNNFSYLDEKLQDIYSTEEKVIGTFLDKPLYRKTILYENETVLHPGNSVIEIPLNLIPIDILVKFDCLVNGNNYKNSDINKYIIPDRYDKDNNKLTLDVPQSYTTNRIVIVIEYTKSTDGGDE